MSGDERRVYDFIVEYLLERNFQPSYREIAEALDIGSTRTVSDYMERLADQGLVERRYARSRAVELPQLALRTDRHQLRPPDAGEFDGVEAPPPGAAGRDEFWMRRALHMARAARARDEVPVGAVLVVGEGRLVVEEHNRTRTRADPTAHAEILALRCGGRAAGDWRLIEATLYVTLEPCAMCAGAIVLARIPRLVFGATDPRAGMCGSLGNIVCDPRLNHRAEVVGGILADESAELLTDFFRARRRDDAGPSASRQDV